MSVALTLGAKTSSWRTEDDHVLLQTPQCRALFKKVLERDKYTCQAQGCGLSLESWLQVHHLDDDHTNNSLENLITLCLTCHMTQHLGLAGLNKLGRLIYLPGIPQPVLQSMISWLELSLFAKDKVPSQVGALRPDVMRFFEYAEEQCISIIGSSDPLDLANIIGALSDDAYRVKLQPKISDMRFLPIYANYPQESIAALKESLAIKCPDVKHIDAFMRAR